MILQVGVKIFLRNTEGKYLFLRRSSSKYPGLELQLDIVGGRIVPGTPLLENLKREVYEETKLTITDDPMLVYAQDILRPDKHVVRLTFTGSADGTPILDEESTEYFWLTIDEFRNRTDIDTFAKEVIEKGLVK